MATNNNHILELWNELEQNAAIGHYKRLYRSDLPFHIYATFQYPEKYYGVALGISESSHININAFESLKDLKVVLNADKSPGSTKLLTIQLLSPSNKGVFATLCDDVIHTIIDIKTEGERVKSIIDQLLRWKSLFDKIKVDGLTEAEQQGLFGELNFLQKLLTLPDLSPIDVLGTWVGVNRELRDFQSGAWAVEVKTTAQSNPTEIKISSERQLDESLLETLYLYHCSVEKSNNNGCTLCEKIGNIRDLLSHNFQALSTFNVKLFEAGYIDEQAYLYAKKAYKIRTEKYYRINGNFPRIKENELRDGVGGVTYSIVLSTCDNYLVTENQILSTFQSLWKK